MLVFTYKLDGAGWATATISDGKNQLVMYISYLSDAPTVLIDALRALLVISPRVTFNWQDEPGEYRWILVKQDEDLHITILWFHDTFSRKPDKEGKVVFSTTCELLKFAIKVRNEFRRVMNEVGLEMYKREWRHGFPLYEYDKLNSLIHNCHHTHSST